MAKYKTYKSGVADMVEYTSEWYEYIRRMQDYLDNGDAEQVRIMLHKLEYNMFQVNHNLAGLFGETTPKGYIR